MKIQAERLQWCYLCSYLPGSAEESDGSRKLSNYSAVYTSSTACLPQCQKCEDTYFKFHFSYTRCVLLCECMADIYICMQEPTEKQLKEVSLYVVNYRFTLATEMYCAGSYTLLIVFLCTLTHWDVHKLSITFSSDEIHLSLTSSAPLATIDFCRFCSQNLQNQKSNIR